MASRLERISKQRQEKLERIRRQGIEPYPRQHRRIHTTQEAITLLEKKEAGSAREDIVNIAGRVMAKRDMGKASFVDIHDSSGKRDRPGASSPIQGWNSARSRDALSLRETSRKVQGVSPSPGFSAGSNTPAIVRRSGDSVHHQSLERQRQR